MGIVARRGSLAAILAAALAGCSDETMVATRTDSPRAASATPPAEAGGPADAEGAALKAATAGRKIIYNARVELVTEDLAALEPRLARLVEAHKGYVADSDVTGSAGMQRSGTWKVRVPVEAYDSFLAGAVALGELVSQRADSQDVSEEYADLDARQANKKVEEQRLLKLLADATGKLDEILSVERELSRVRGEIERVQGRLRALADLTSLTTVTVSAREIKGFTPADAPTFATRIGRTFAASVESLRLFGESVVLLLVGLTPWLPLIALGLAAAWLPRRRARRRAAKAP